MGQRINIQYSIEVDDLAREAGRLVESAFIEYQTLQADCTLQPADRVLSYEMAERIDEIRLKLGAIDHRLNDVSNIIFGYLNYKAQEQSTHQKEMSPSSIETTAQDIEAKLERIKESLGTSENEVSD
tara:strand:- start:1116 stop:1496 length:381 start_codon:yes stop_codon:yes gene_type:complete